MTLFTAGKFKSSSGLILDGKIDCDALTDADIECCAEWIIHKYGAEWRWVEGVPTGGHRLARALRKRVTGCVWFPLLIVDDVLTTGASMERLRAGREAVDIIIFQRGPGPDWVHSLFQFK